MVHTLNETAKYELGGTQFDPQLSLVKESHTGPRVQISNHEFLLVHTSRLTMKPGSHTFDKNLMHFDDAMARACANCFYRTYGKFNVFVVNRFHRLSPSPSLRLPSLEPPSLAQVMVKSRRSFTRGVQSTMRGVVLARRGAVLAQHIVTPPMSAGPAI